MIISKTPVRMSFVGGGSDLPNFYREYGGAVVSTTIDKYVYVTVNEKFDDAIRVSYSKTQEVANVDEIEHKLIREALKLLKIHGGIEITSVADIPSRGTGLGSSSAFCVGLLNALCAFKRRYAPAEYLAKTSCHVEIDLLKEPIGKQDQYSCAYGGLNFIRFNPDDTVSVDPIICLSETVQRLERNIIVFYTGITRSASAILKEQDEGVRTSLRKQETLRRMVELAYSLRDDLTRNHVETFGEYLHENWLLKKSLSEEISNSGIDHWYERARDAGAIGGKLLGAGSGGFLMFYAPYEMHGAIAKALSPLRQVQFSFESQGSKIIFVH